MKSLHIFCGIGLLILVLLVLGITPVAAQDPDVQESDLYLPYVNGRQAVVPAAAEQPVENGQAAAQNAVPAAVRHEPGHAAAVKDLDVRVATGEVSDPLAGNTTLAYWEKIAIVFHGPTNKLTHKTYDVDANLGAPVAKERVGSTVDVAGGGNLDVAAGHFTGAEDWMDTVAVWESTTGKIALYVESYNSSLVKSVDATASSNDVVAGANTGWPMYGGKVRVAGGDFDGDGYDEFAVAWEGASASLNLRVWDTNGGVTPTAKGAIAGETLGGYKFLDVATGDFNGDGEDEIAVAWQGADSYLTVKVFSVSSTGSLVAQARLAETGSTIGNQVITPIPPGRIVITAGDFNGDAIDEIAVGYNVPAYSNIFVYQVSTDLKTLTKKGTASASSGAGSSTLVEKVGRQLGLQVGDFNTDGIDELALVYGAPGKWYCNVSVYATDVLTPTLRATQYVNWGGAMGICRWRLAI